MRAIIIAVGDELLSGAAIDTNSAYLSEQLAARGIAAVAHWTVGDDEQAVADAVARAAGSAEIVVVTGGLGPTADDLTRQGLARASGAELVLDEKSLAQIENFFRIRGRQMQPINRIQAMIPAGAEALQNTSGTAPGIASRLGNARVFVLPGVPHEMKTMFEAQVAPQLPQLTGVIVSRAIHTFGLGESDVAAKIADLMVRDANPLIGVTVEAGLVTVRMASRAESSQAARRQADAVAGEIKKRLGQVVIGEDDATLAWAVGELLRRRGQRLATSESCTGGLVGQLITSVPGSSDYYVGGVVAYADEVKHDSLGVDRQLIAARGAVSEEVAAAMARGCRVKFRSDWAIGVTGIAGPRGGTDEKPVGLVYVAIAGPAGVQVYRQIFPGTREVVRMRTALAAINYLRLALLG